MDIVNLQCWPVWPDERTALRINCELVFSFVFFLLGEQQMKHFSFVCFLGMSATGSACIFLSFPRLKNNILFLVIFAKL